MTSTLTRTNVERAETALAHLRLVVYRLRESREFETVHQGRWRHLASGHHVETGYSYGEGVLRVFLGGVRKVDHRFVLSGRGDDLVAFNALFPVSGA